MAGRNKNVHFLIGTSATAIALALSATAYAETQLGSGTLSAQAVAGWTYNDNLFAANGNPNVGGGNVITQEQDDWAITFAPSVSWASDWASGNNVTIEAGAQFNRQDQFEQDDANQYNAGLKGELNVNDSTVVTYGADYVHGVESRGSAIEFGSLQPVKYDELGANVGILKTGGVFEVSLGVGVVDSDFEDGQAIDPNGGAQIARNNDDRDSLVTTVQGRISYAVARRSAVYLSASYNMREFDELEDAVSTTTGGVTTNHAGINRDSDGYTVGGGVTINLSDVSTVSVGVSYHDQGYDDARLNDVDGFGGSATFVWLPTELTTVAATVSHEYNDTSLQTVSGSLTHGAALSVDHHLTDRLNVTLDLSASRAEYENGTLSNVGNSPIVPAGIDREDDTLTAGIAFGYAVNDAVTLGASANYVDRDSNVDVGTSNDDYDTARYGLTATVRM